MNANRVLIIGDSGTGKTTSLQHFTPDEVCVIACAGKPAVYFDEEAQRYKPLPVIIPSFNKLTDDVLKAMNATDKKVIVIDDAQYIMSFQYMRRIKENGWDKWNDIQGDFFNIIKHCDELPEDTIVYFLSHLQRDDEGHEKVKTMGKMLDEKITIEGLFTIVLKTIVKDGQYLFVTQNSGMDTVKSPIGMFQTYAIANDLKYVDDRIRNYYEIGEYIPDAEMAKADLEAAVPEVEKPAAAAPVAEGRRRRSRSTIAEVDTGTGTIVGATPAEQKAIEAEELKMEAPKQRRRKERADGQTEEEKPAETPVEEKKEEGGRKRRRKAVNNPADFMEVPEEVSDDEIPFD